MVTARWLGPLRTVFLSLAGRRVTPAAMSESNHGDAPVMGLHKLTAGDGYMYLIRQVAASDATDRGRPSLSDYYSAKGEAPGTWMGHGLAALGSPASRDATDPLVAKLWAVPPGSPVSEEQMKALFGEGLHPNADQITRHLTGVGVAKAGAIAAARLGRPFVTNNKENRFTTRLRAAYRDYNAHRRKRLPSQPRSVRSGPGCAPRWGGKCSPKPTLAHRQTSANCPDSSPANPARPPPRSPATT